MICKSSYLHQECTVNSRRICGDDLCCFISAGVLLNPVIHCCHQAPGQVLSKYLTTKHTKRDIPFMFDDDRSSKMSYQKLIYLKKLHHFVWSLNAQWIVIKCNGSKWKYTRLKYDFQPAKWFDQGSAMKITHIEQFAISCVAYSIATRGQNGWFIFFGTPICWNSRFEIQVFPCLTLSLKPKLKWL